MLEDKGILTKTGLTVWSIGSIQNILRNEKYTGDALLQKTYTIDPMSPSRKNGQKRAKKSGMNREVQSGQAACEKRA